MNFVNKSYRSRAFCSVFAINWDLAVRSYKEKKCHFFREKSNQKSFKTLRPIAVWSVLIPQTSRKSRVGGYTAQRKYFSVCEQTKKPRFATLHIEFLIAKRLRLAIANHRFLRRLLKCLKNRYVMFDQNQTSRFARL